MKAEVDFEKRGRLEDHQVCPVCQCCVCWCGHVKMIVLAFFLFTFTFLLQSSALANGKQHQSRQTEIDYDITTLNTLGLQDINNNRDLLRDDFQAGTSPQLIVNKKRHSPAWAARTIDIGCPNSEPDFHLARKLNNRQEVAGFCAVRGVGNVGFVRHRDDTYSLLSFPGATFTDVFGLNDNPGANVVGQFEIPSPTALSAFDTVHGFARLDGIYRQIDFPLDDTFVVVVAVNRTPRALGQYWPFNRATNEIGLPVAFLWDNGNFTVLTNPGSPWVEAIDMNNNDQILLGDPDGYLFHDDGRFFRVNLPDTIGGLPAVFDVNGMNDYAELTGEYRTFEGDCSTVGSPCKITRKGFIATPVTNRKGKH